MGLSPPCTNGSCEARIFSPIIRPWLTDPVCGATVRKRAPKAPILIILHQEHSTPGRVGRLLRERGHPLDIRRPRFGDPFPTRCGTTRAR